MDGVSHHTAAPSSEYLERATTRVRVFTPSGVLEGLYAHPAGVRLSDSLRNAASAERYLLLTDVRIRSLEGGAIDGEIDSAPFVLLRSEHASMIVPLEEE